MLEHASLHRGHHLPREVIAHAVRLYLRFALSFPDVEELLAELRAAHEPGQWRAAAAVASTTASSNARERTRTRGSRTATDVTVLE